MWPELLQYIRCPRCGESCDGEFEEWDAGHVMSGSLACRGCRADYPIRAGVPRMNVEVQGLEQVTEAFNLQWKEHHRGGFEATTVYGWTPEQDWALLRRALDLDDDGVVGASVLDAGCGHGRFTRQFAEREASAVIGIDVVDAVEDAFAQCRTLPNAHVVQANVAAPPVALASQDLIWCRGVLHHTPDPVSGHRALARCVKPGGKLYVWVYARRFNPFRFVRDVFDALRITRLAPNRLLAVCRLMAYPSLAALSLYRAARSLPGLRATTARSRRTVRSRGLREVQLTWFDALAPEFNSRHTEDEVVGWFRSVDFVQIACLDEPKVGVRGTAP